MRDDFELAIWTSIMCLAGVFAVALWILFEMWR